MNAPFHLGLDIDGILSDYNTRAANMIATLTGRRLTPDPMPEPNTWHWMRAYGYLKSEEDRFWDVVERSADFWTSLRPYDNVQWFLSWVSQRHPNVRTTFITTRPGLTAHAQTVQWLQAIGNLKAPQVCISANASAKGQLAAALGLNLYVDDHGPNLAAVAQKSPLTRLVLYQRPWNEQDRPAFEGSGVHQVESLQQLQAYLMTLPAFHGKGHYDPNERVGANGPAEGAQFFRGYRDKPDD